MLMGSLGRNGDFNSTTLFAIYQIIPKNCSDYWPLKADDYRKAFFQAVSTKTFEIHNKPLSAYVQKSVAYFNALGIDNYQVMMQLMSSDIFLEGLKESETKGEGQTFVQSEVDKRLKTLEEDVKSLKNEVNHIATEKNKQVADFQQKKQKLEADSERDRQLAQTKLDEQAEANRQAESRHQEQIEKERQQFNLQHIGQQLETKRQLLSTLNSTLNVLNLQNGKLYRRAKFHLASSAALLGVCLSILVLYFKGELVAIKEFVDPVLFAFSLPVALFGAAYWLFMGTEFSKDKEAARSRILNWYKKRLDKRNAFDIVHYNSLRQQVEQLRTELGIEAPTEQKLLTTQS